MYFAKLKLLLQCDFVFSFVVNFILCHTFCSLHAVMSSLIYYSTHAQKNVIYSICLLKIVFHWLYLEQKCR